VPFIWVAGVQGRDREAGQGGRSYPERQTVGTAITADGTKNGRFLASCGLLKPEGLVHPSDKKNSGLHHDLNEVTMKTTGLLNAFPLIAVRRSIQDLLTFFRFTQAEAFALLSAYGLHALEQDRLQNDRPDKPKETDGSLGTVSHCKPISDPPVPIPLGVHPDFTRVHWRAASRKQVHRYHPEPPSSLSPLQRREPTLAPPPLKPESTRRWNEPDQSTKDLLTPADLDTAFEKILEGCCIDWPERLATEKFGVGIAELVAAAFVLAALVVLAQWTVLS
jgi:hypothetical protein